MAKKKWKKADKKALKAEAFEEGENTFLSGR
jgi:hypothetical protein